MAKTKSVNRPAAMKIALRLPTVPELRKQLGEKQEAVASAQAALKAAKGVRNLARTALAEALEAELPKGKKPPKK
jgi:hypothetical protein